MPRNGSGTYTLPAGNPVVTGTIISSTTQNTTMSDVATALTNSIAKDGQTVPTANLPMGGFKHTGAADATATGQYLTYGQDNGVLGDTTIAGTLTVDELATWAKGADVASATTLPLIADGNYFDVTGTTTITAFASLGVGTWIGLHFDDALTLTHNATDLILPTGANITTAAGDEAIFVEYASGDWRCVSYTRANGTALVTVEFASEAEYIAGTNTTKALNSAVARAQNLVSGTLTALSGTSVGFTGIPAWAKRITFMYFGSTNGVSPIQIQIGDSSGYATTGYVSSCGLVTTSNDTTRGATSTTGILTVTAVAASQTHNCTLTAHLADPATNTWLFTGTCNEQSAGNAFFSSGRKSLTGTLDRIRVTMVNGTDAFDSGSCNIIYE